MIRRYALVTTSALLILASTPMTTFASHGVAPQQRRPVVRLPASMALTMRYFKALQPHGRSIHDYATLMHLYSPHVTLTETLSTGLPRSHTELAPMRAFDELNTLTWSVLSATQLSPTVVLAVERPFTMGPGHELEDGAPWSTQLTVMYGTIVNLVWRSLAQPDQRRTPSTSASTQQTR